MIRTHVLQNTPNIARKKQTTKHAKERNFRLHKLRLGKEGNCPFNIASILDWHRKENAILPNHEPK